MDSLKSDRVTEIMVPSIRFPPKSERSLSFPQGAVVQVILCQRAGNVKIQPLNLKKSLYS
jgi:hypothetical protein